MLKKVNIVLSMAIALIMVLAAFGPAAAQTGGTGSGTGANGNNGNNGGGATSASGRVGIFLPGAVSTSNFMVEKIHRRDARWTPFKLESPVLWLRTNFQSGSQGGQNNQSGQGASLPNTGGQQSGQQSGQQQSGGSQNQNGSVPTQMTYVFFKLTAAQLRQWQQGDLGIFYWDRQRNQWTACGAFAANGSQSGSQSGNNSAQGSQSGQNSNGNQSGNQNNQRSQDQRRNAGTLACIAPQWNTVYALGMLRDGQSMDRFINNSNQNSGQGSNGQGQNP